MTPHTGKVQNWTRDELEDAYLRIYDENQELRRVVAEQNIKVKTYDYIF